MKIGFWGGEPTLNVPAMKRIVERLSNLDFIIHYSIATNGYNINEDIINFFIETNKTDNRTFEVQVSYDGNPIHDICRRTCSGETTSKRVVENVEKMFDAGLRPNFKSTATFKHFDKMYDSYMDIVNISDRIGRNMKYALTLDYSYQTMESLTEEEFNESLNNLKSSLVKIAKEEIHRSMNLNKPPTFTWFDKNENVRKICGAGSQYQLIDHDGCVYVCHGCVYVPKKEDHLICNIEDPIELAAEALKRTNDILEPATDFDKVDCKDCNASVCFRCNATKYIQSKKENYFDRWTDFSCEPLSCKMYRLASVIRDAKRIKEEEVALSILKANQKE